MTLKRDACLGQGEGRSLERMSQDVREVSNSAQESSYINRLCRLSQEANTMASTNASQYQDSK